MAQTRIALLSNPKSTGNRSQLPRIRAFCAEHPDIFHYEVETIDQVGEALRTIARVNPKLLVINGGDGTVQAALTEMTNGAYFGDSPPPMAVLPNGKTNLIALDLGAQGDPVIALDRLLGLARADLSPHLVARELIALRYGAFDSLPVIGMFLGGGGLADTMLYCRERIYPLGLPNGLSHAITAFALLVRMLFGLRSRFLPPAPKQLQVSVLRQGLISGRFTLLAVTTLERLLLSSDLRSTGQGRLKLMAIDHHAGSLLRGIVAGLRGRLGQGKLRGVHIEESDEIRIEGDCPKVILDGETFQAGVGRSIHLSPAPPLSFVRLAA